MHSIRHVRLFVAVVTIASAFAVGLPGGGQAQGAASVVPGGDDGLERDLASTAGFLPPVGGLTYGAAGTTDPAELANTLPFAVDSISAFEIATQRWLIYLPGAPAFAISLTSDDLESDSLIWVKRSAGDQQEITDAEWPIAGSGHMEQAQALPPPPRGGLTVGTGGAESLEELLQAQTITVASAVYFDAEAQEYRTWVSGAPDWVNTLDQEQAFSRSSVVWMRRAGDDSRSHRSGNNRLPRVASVGPVNSDWFVEPEDTSDRRGGSGSSGGSGNTSSASESSGSGGSGDSGDPGDSGGSGGSDTGATATPASMSTAPSGSAGETVQYQATDAIFPNPERGVFGQYVTGSSGYSSLGDLSSYRDTHDSTLIRRIFNIEQFQGSDSISSGYLSNMQADFDRLRQQGFKAVIRFAYTYSAGGHASDVSYDQMARHMDQLAPVVNANRDVIAGIEAGFIGRWGEWHDSSHFSDEWYGNDWSDRIPALQKILDSFHDRPVVLRYPRHIRFMVENGHVSSQSRLGFKNDAFLSNSDEMGTWESGHGDRGFIEGWVPGRLIGGEHEGGQSDSFLRDNFNDFATYHWSYLNIWYNERVTDFWKSNSHPTQSGTYWDEIQRRLGYRLQLDSTAFSATASSGGSLAVDIRLSNVGWAAPYNPRRVELVLRHQQTGDEHRVALSADPRQWRPGSAAQIQQDVTLPGSISAGTYDLFLHLGDEDSGLRSRPEYSIRLANQDVWESSTGYNSLRQQVTVE